MAGLKLKGIISISFECESCNFAVAKSLTKDDLMYSSIESIIEDMEKQHNFDASSNLCRNCSTEVEQGQVYSCSMCYRIMTRGILIKENDKLYCPQCHRKLRRGE